jgi:hypothetical protein
MASGSYEDTSKLDAANHHLHSKGSKKAQEKSEEPPAYADTFELILKAGLREV